MNAMNQAYHTNDTPKDHNHFNDGIQILINNLAENNPILKTKIKFINQALQWRTQGMTDAEKRKAQRILDDYTFKTRWREYQAVNFSITRKQQEWINKINSQENNAFKKYVEVAACQVISAWIRDEHRKRNNDNVAIKMLLASDYDDIIQWIDYIVSVTDTTKNTRHVYSIDLAVTKKLDYVREKIAKDKKTPLEFLTHMNLPSDFHMEKYIIAIPPDIMGAFIVELIHLLEYGKYSDLYQKNNERTPSEFDIFKKIYTFIDHKSLLKPHLEEIRSGIRERVWMVTNMPIL